MWIALVIEWKTLANYYKCHKTFVSIEYHFINSSSEENWWMWNLNWCATIWSQMRVDLVAAIVWSREFPLNSLQIRFYVVRGRQLKWNYDFQFVYFKFLCNSCNKFLLYFMFLAKSSNLPSILCCKVWKLVQITWYSTISSNPALYRYPFGIRS